MAKKCIIQFGYLIENGEVLVHPEEQKEVIYIFSNYSVPQKFHNVESEKNEQKKL